MKTTTYYQRGQRIAQVRAWVVPVALFLFALAGPLTLFLTQEPHYRSQESTVTMASFGGTPIRLSSVDDSLADMYRGVKAHGEHMKLIPCFCGCDRTLEHRHLLDCFVLKDGSGWESHATGCSVCRGEARMALALLDEGVDAHEVQRRVIDEYGMSDAMKEMIEETT